MWKSLLSHPHNRQTSLGPLWTPQPPEHTCPGTDLPLCPAWSWQYQCSQTTGRSWLQLLGHMATCMFVTPLARLHSQCLQACLRTIYMPNKHSLHKHVSVAYRVLDFLNCWKDPQKLCSSSVLAASFPMDDHYNHITYGWRCALQKPHSSGQMDPSGSDSSYQHIRVQSSSLCLRALPTPYKGLPEQNNAEQQSSNCQGVARSWSLWAKSIKLWNWCLLQHIQISAV